MASLGSRLARGAIALAALALSVPACGPSLRLVEQSNVYFEQCHALDRDRDRTDAERRACWQAWHEHHRVGQPDDRIDYVRERLVMLDPASGDAIALATNEGDLGGGAQGTETTATEEIASGETTSLPPPEGPELSDSFGHRPARARRRPVAPRTRASACGVSCEPAFVSCAERCSIADRGCTDACRHIFRQCARGCF